MKPKSIMLTILLFAGVFSFSMIGYLSGVRAEKKEAAPPPVVAVQKAEIPDIFETSSNAATKNIVKDFTETYILRENEGRLALFIRYSNGDEQIHSDYDISVKLLPKNDREALEAGIELSSLDSALQLVEDYMS